MLVQDTEYIRLQKFQRFVSVIYFSAKHEGILSAHVVNAYIVDHGLFDRVRLLGCFTNPITRFGTASKQVLKWKLSVPPKGRRHSLSAVYTSKRNTKGTMQMLCRVGGM
jgi:hypothetical protein